ncbi:MAG: glycosyltransferase family 2 protein [Actinomycetota bacterium]|nr:glycosyltransferase family 2 protein [Actinomycetota bacterium]
MVLLTWLVWLGYYVAIISVLLGATWTVVLYAAGSGYVKDWRARPSGNEAAYLWAFLVPALNEAVTIADSVARLRAVEATNKIIIVINDGSDDNTGEVLEQIGGPDLIVHTRVAPNARRGKAAALDDAYQFLLRDLLSRDEYRTWTPEQVIVGIVDADGRLATTAPVHVGRHFDNPRVGGVQVNVRIYNRSSFLTRMQQLEFEVFGGLYQAGRSRWGAAFMGGNGQFNRLAALESVADDEGPWSHYLTEDQELGLRLLSRGWFGEQEAFTHVDQQGLNSLKRLYKQRTRWMQGNLQVVGSLRRLNAHHLLGIRRLDALVSLLLPVLTLIVGVAVISGMVLWIGFGYPYLPVSNVWLTVVMVVLALGPVSLGVLVVARGRGWRGGLASLKAFVPYMVYIWLMWPVAFLGLYRLIRGQRGWVKTARESIAK